MQTGYFGFVVGVRRDVLEIQRYKVSVPRVEDVRYSGSISSIILNLGTRCDVWLASHHDSFKPHPQPIQVEAGWAPQLSSESF